MAPIFYMLHTHDFMSCNKKGDWFLHNSKLFSSEKRERDKLSHYSSSYRAPQERERSFDWDLIPI